jgi:aryl-alcohol dehydrogenase-like predicted oxidoreductase
VRSWLIRTDRHTILLDCCVGNHKNRPDFRQVPARASAAKQWHLGILDQINRRFATERNWDVMEAQQSFCLYVLALAWLAAQPVVASIIAGASNTDQLEANFNALTWKLTDAEKAEVDRIIST